MIHMLMIFGIYSGICIFTLKSDTLKTQEKPNLFLYMLVRKKFLCLVVYVIVQCNSNEETGILTGK